MNKEKKDSKKPASRLKKVQENLETEAFASPVCYAGSENIRPEYQDKDPEISEKPKEADKK